MAMDQVLDRFVDANRVELSIYLLHLVSDPSQGGRGYHITYANPFWELDGWEVNHTRREISLDIEGVLPYFPQEIAQHLRDCLEVEFLQSRVSLGSRLGWGTASVLLGTVETAVGVLGILVPVPGTTMAGIAAVTLGVNTVVDGVSQLGGANQGRGINLLETAFSAAGAELADVADLDPALGAQIGRGLWLARSLSGRGPASRSSGSPASLFFNGELAGSRAASRLGGSMQSMAATAPGMGPHSSASQTTRASRSSASSPITDG